MSEIYLAHCPFCGGEASICRIKSLDDPFYLKFKPHCTVCHAELPTHCDTMIEAANRWNVRFEMPYSGSVPAGNDRIVFVERPKPTPIKQGFWINKYGDRAFDPRDRNNWWDCSVCGYSTTTLFKSQFCPECGSEMLEESAYEQDFD